MSQEQATRLQALKDAKAIVDAARSQTLNEPFVVWQKLLHAAEYIDRQQNACVTGVLSEAL